MGDLYNKANAPYLIAGALATLVLLASGTLAVAPYVEFLSSVAAFNVALPVALSLSILSVLVLVLSCKMISQNKKLDAQKAEPNEKNGLAKEQENIIQSLEPQIKELNKRLSSQYNEIEKLIASAAKKEELNKLNNEVKELKVKIASVATKEEINKLSNEVEKLIGSAATKDEMEELKAKIASAATESKTQEKIFMKFCAKGEKRGKKAFEDFIFIKEIKTKLVNIYESIKNNINIVSSAKSGDSEEEQEKIQRGFIFHGPGGTGKSSIVEAIGDQLISLTTFIKVSGADLLEKSNINELFNKANENAPCIVLIDEIDSFGKGRTDANRVPLNYFFTRFDEADKGVTVFATTNVSLQDLDASLVRGSRLSSKLKFTMIEGSILKNILKDGLNEKLKNKKYKHAISRILNETTLTTLSISAADVECFINYIVEKLNNKIGTSAYTIIKDFYIKYNIGEVSNKQTNRKIENSIGESQQYTSRPSHKLNDALCSLATLTLLTSLALIVTSNVPLPLILALATLSILVLALSCKIISNNVELEAKVKGHLEHKEEMLSLEHQELRDENTRLNEKVDSLMEELCQCKLESEKNKLCLKSEYEDELRLRLEYEDELNLELEHKSREASSLRTQLTMLRKKVEVEEVKQLKTLESEEQHESSESDIEELEKKLCQSEKEKKELEGKVSDERQKRTDLESKVDKLCTKEKEYLSKIKELEKESLSLQKEEKESDNTLTTVNDDRDNKVKELNSSLLKQSSQIEQLQKALLEKKKEEVLFLQWMIEYVTDEVEKLVRENEVIRDDDKKVILQVIQATKSELVEEAAQYLPGETSVPSFVEDPGYTSGCSTPINSH